MAAPTVLSGALIATGPSAAVGLKGPFSVEIRGSFVGTVIIERSIDDGANWVQPTAFGTQYGSWTAPASEGLEEIANGVLYRFNCTAYTSGTINYKVTQ